jgi:hypothetical protein
LLLPLISNRIEIFCIETFLCTCIIFAIRKKGKEIQMQMSLLFMKQYKPCFAIIGVSILFMSNEIITNLIVIRWIAFFFFFLVQKSISFLNKHKAIRTFHYHRGRLDQRPRRRHIACDTTIDPIAFRLLLLLLLNLSLIHQNAAKQNDFYQCKSQNHVGIDVSNTTCTIRIHRRSFLRNIYIIVQSLSNMSGGEKRICEYLFTCEEQRAGQL